MKALWFVVIVMSCVEKERTKEGRRKGDIYVFVLDSVSHSTSIPWSVLSGKGEHRYALYVCMYTHTHTPARTHTPQLYYT
jgi:hypothetical protein